jgi:hypothetical protein
VTVAVVDSGAFAAHPHLAGVRLSGFSVVGAEAPFSMDSTFDDRTGHGTAAAAAIVWSEPNIDLCIVRVLDEDLRTTTPALAEGIRRAAEAGARVINLSVGSTRPEAAAVLQAAVSDARESGAVCVANAHPRGRALWPGDLPSVISATSHRDCPRADLFAVRGPLPRFVAHGFPRPADGRLPTDNFFGPSFACAHVSARVAALLLATPSLDFDGVVAALRASCRAEVDAA